MSIFFFLWVREFFVLHRMVGRTWRGVLTPGYFEPCNFPSLSSILAWRIPWTEEPDGLQSTGSQRVGHDWATLLTYSHTCTYSLVYMKITELDRKAWEPRLVSANMWHRYHLSHPTSIPCPRQTLLIDRCRLSHWARTGVQSSFQANILGSHFQEIRVGIQDETCLSSCSRF